MQEHFQQEWWENSRLRKKKIRDVADLPKEYSGHCWVAKRVAAGARTSDAGRYSCTGVNAILSTIVW
jgi:hypothetical protein